MARGYSYVLAEAVGEFVLALPPEEQQRLVRCFRRLAGDPFQHGDYATADGAGRALQNLLVEDWVVTYWPDHGARELRIVEIARV